jgi:hypothetical protein
VPRPSPVGGRSRDIGRALKGWNVNTEAKDAEIEQEITNHGVTWCSPTCQTFLPEEYRLKRERYEAGTVQSDYDLCHAWR